MTPRPPLVASSRRPPPSAAHCSSGRATVALVRRWPRATAARCSSGQATVEFVALLPLVLLVGLAVAALLAGHGAREHAGLAAQAAAMALLQDGDPEDAARWALPREVRGRATVEVHGRRVTVRVRPDLPLRPAAKAMTAEVSADAGPEPSP
jgi:hypothetical protein